MDKRGLNQIRQEFFPRYQFHIEVSENDCHFNIHSPFFPPYCRAIFRNSLGYGKCLDSRFHALETARQTGRENIFLCHAGLICCVYPVMQGLTPVGGIFMGKVRICSENEKNVEFPQISREMQSELELLKAAWNNTVMITPEKFQKAVDTFVKLVKKIFKQDAGALREKLITSYQQSQIADVIHQQKLKSSGHLYPYQLEKELQEKVASADRMSAIKILNDILGNILFGEAGDLPMIRTRMQDLVIILSRAVQENEPDQDRIFQISREYVKQIGEAAQVEKMCLCLAEALERFLNMAESGQAKQKHRALHLALAYVHGHFGEKLTLRTVARQAGISAFRLAHLFPQVLGLTFVDYVSSLRVNSARKLLAASDLTATEIAFRTGFSDQSYFTKVFKKIVGMTPKRFQIENKRLRQYYLSEGCN